MPKLFLLFLASFVSAYAQPVLDSVSMSGLQANVTTFSWSNTTSSQPNRGIVVVGNVQDLFVLSATLGSTPLVLATDASGNPGRCYDTTYVTESMSFWTLPKGVQPPSGSAQLTLTLSAPTQFHSTSRAASAVAYNFSNVDQSQPIGEVACHATQMTPRQAFTTDTLPITTGVPHEFAVFGMNIPNTNDPAKLFNWPGTQDQIYFASLGTVQQFSHLADTGAAGATSYRWDWLNLEPFADGVVTVRPFGTISPPPSGTVYWGQGSLASRPATCPNDGLTFYIATDLTPQMLYYCGPGSGWLPTGTPAAPLPGGDNWDMAFHDAQHTGRSSDIVMPPLTLAWQWQDNWPFDSTPHELLYDLPIAFDDKICFQGGRNSNRVFCLKQDRSFSWLANNSGYTEAGLYQFYNYPVHVGSVILFGSVDFTTVVNTSDGTTTGLAPNLYNTNGGYPIGGSVALTGSVFQQFLESDEGAEDLVLYQVPPTLVRNQNYRSPSGQALNDIDFRIPTVDSGVVYANIFGGLQARDSNTFALLWSAPAAMGAMPAASGGAVYCYADGAMTALKAGVKLWSTPMPAALSPIVSQGTLYVGAADGALYALNTLDGTLRWKFQTGSPFTSLQIPALSGALIYVPSADTKIYALDAAKGTMVSFFQGATAWGPIIIAHGLLYSSDANGAVYAFSPAAALLG